MWYYFYSHPACWYKVLHLSQTSFGWAVEVKAEPLRVAAAQLARWLAQANINRARPGAMWQLHHHRLLATSWGFLPPTLDGWSLQSIPEEKGEIALQEKPANVVSRRANACADIFPPDFPVHFQMSNVFPQFPIFSCPSDLSPAGKADKKLFSWRFCLALNARSSLSYWIVVYAEQTWRCTGIFVCFIFQKKKRLFNFPVISRTRLLLP